MNKNLQIETGFVISFILGTLLLTIFIPDASSQAVADKGPFIALLLLIGGAFGVGRIIHKKNAEAITDIFLVITTVILLWEVLLSKLALLDPFLFPGPAKVFLVFQNDGIEMLNGVISSLGILSTGYLLALATAIPLGLLIGWRKRLFNVSYPIAKAISPIPPTVYLPYAIVLLPTFTMSSIFMIFIGAFWPIMVGSIYGVFSIDPRIINSARTLGLSEFKMIRRILLPAATPTIFSGALIALIVSFITLTVAEMIAATSGLGWYIQYHHQFANYDKVIAGMILITVIVILIMFVFDRIQEYVLRWQQKSE